MKAGRRVVIGVGNDYRRDDGLGPLVVAALTDRQADDPRLAEVDLRVSDGEPTRLIDLWTDADLAIVVDAVLDDGHHAGHRHELSSTPCTSSPTGTRPTPTASAWAAPSRSGRRSAGSPTGWSYSPSPAPSSASAKA